MRGGDGLVFLTLDKEGCVLARCIMLGCMTSARCLGQGIKHDPGHSSIEGTHGREGYISGKLVREALNR